MCKDVSYYCELYDKHKNLKIAAEEAGIKWQKLYTILTKAKHPVTGDKEIYGSETDKFARKTENKFKELVPYAEDHNKDVFQNKIDFSIGNIKVDVKASTKKDGYKCNPRKNPSYRWAFSCSVQRTLSDFLVLFCYSGYSVEDCGDIEKILLIPCEFYKNKQSISVSCSKSKWYDFEVSEKDLKEFFVEFT